MITTAVILAAGRGTRLKEVTKTRSKAMAPVAGLPMLGRVMDSLRGAGIERWIIVAAPNDDRLKAYCAELPHVVVREQSSPRGSGDALRVCEDDLDRPFLVAACDSLLSSVDVRGALELFVARSADAVVATLEVKDDVSLHARSVLRVEAENIKEFIEKPSDVERCSNVTGLPLWVLSPRVFSELRALEPSPRGEYELPAIFNSMIAKSQRVLAYRAAGRCDLTTVDDLLELNKEFLKELSPSISIHPSVRIPASVKFAPPVLVSEGCEIGEGAQVGPYVYLEAGSRIEAKVVLQNAVVLSGVTVIASSAGKVFS
jgi:NDP-sugar pyrophosphorylase family protein